MKIFAQEKHYTRYDLTIKFLYSLKLLSTKYSSDTHRFISGKRRTHTRVAHHVRILQKRGVVSCFPSEAARDVRQLFAIIGSPGANFRIIFNTRGKLLPPLSLLLFGVSSCSPSRRFLSYASPCY